MAEPSRPFGTLSAGPEPSWRDHLTDLMAQYVYGGGKGGQAMARQATGLADFTPGVGTGLAIDDTARALGEGNYGEAALNALGVIPEVGPGAKAMILGLGAKLKPVERGAQALAEVMAANGATRDEIFKKTGWFQQHGDWKTEISDKDMKFSEPAMEALLGKEGNYKGYLGPDRQPDLFTGKEGPGAIEHPELFERHPDLENVPVNIQMNYRGRAGGFHPQTGIEVEGVSTDDARDVLTHEIQHAVQTAEGFPKGGNPSDRSLQKPMQKVKKGAEARVTELMDEREAFIRQRQAAGDPRNPTQLAKVWQTGNPEKAKEFDAVIGTSLGPAGPTAGYHHLAGETEARNVAKRRDMDQMELFQTPPWQTQDLPDSLQIVRHQPGRDDLVQAMARQPVDDVRADVDTMFEQGVSPNVPQGGIKRYEPPRGVPARVTDLTTNKKVRTGTLEAIERGKQMGGADWYNMEPLRLEFAKQFGEDEGTQRFNRYLDHVAGSSPRSSVPENLRNASYYYGLDVNNMPLEEPRVIPGGGRGGADKKVKNPEPYGHIAQDLHRMNFEKIRSGKGLDFKANPKPLGFAEGLKGNMTPVAVDTHAFRLPAILSKDPRFLERRYQSVPGAPIRNIQEEVASGQTPMKTAAGEPAFWSSKPEENEYAAMERFYQSLAKDAGLTPAQTQAAAWVGGGDLTGLRSDETKTAMDLFKDVVARTAVKRNMDPREVLAKFMSGQSPLLSLAGVGLGAGALLPDQDGGQP